MTVISWDVMRSIHGFKSRLHFCLPHVRVEIPVGVIAHDPFHIMSHVGATILIEECLDIGRHLHRYVERGLKLEGVEDGPSSSPIFPLLDSRAGWTSTPSLFVARTNTLAGTPFWT